MVEDVDGLLLHVLGPLRRGEEVGRGDHNRDVIVKEVRRLGDPARRQVVFRGQWLRPMLRPVPFREQQAVASGVGNKGRHHVVGLAVLAAILGKLQGRAIGGRSTPETAERTRAVDGVLRVRPTLVVAAFEVVPTLQHQTGVREARTDRLSGHHDGVGHTPWTVHDELDVGQLRHVLYDPLRAQLGNPVQGVAGWTKSIHNVHGDGSAFLPVRPGRGYWVEDQTVNLVWRHAIVGNRSTQGQDAPGADTGLRGAVPAPGRWRVSDTDGRDLAAMFPQPQALSGAIEGSGRIL